MKAYIFGPYKCGGILGRTLTASDITSQRYTVFGHLRIIELSICLGFGQLSSLNSLKDDRIIFFRYFITPVIPTPEYIITGCKRTTTSWPRLSMHGTKLPVLKEHPQCEATHSLQPKRYTATETTTDKLRSKGLFPFISPVKGEIEGDKPLLPHSTSYLTRTVIKEHPYDYSYYHMPTVQ